MNTPHLMKVVLVSALSLSLFTSAVAAVVDASKSSANTNVPKALTTTEGYASDRIIVRFKNTQVFSRAQASALNAQIDTQVVRSFPHIRGMHVLRGRRGQSVKELLTAYRSNPNVLYAEPDYRVEIQLTPNDTRYPEMWALNNTGQTGGIVDADINAPQAWDITTGSPSVVVGVIDTGIDYTHADLVANLWVNTGEVAGNAIDDDANGYVDDVYGINAITNSGNPLDDNGHGTHTAGTIGAVGNNNLGVAGVSLQVKLVACKFLNASGSGNTSDAIECFNYLLALKSKGVNVVLSNNSWGGGGFSTALRDAIKANQDAGILTVAAAGNAATNTDASPSYPAGYDLPGIVTVAATDSSDRLAPFSNYGLSTVDVGAPGVAILSTFPVASTCALCTAGNQYNSAGYGVISGTSMATPQVAGLAALIKAQDPSRTTSQIKNLIMTSGQSIPALLGKTVSGKRIRAADVTGAGALTCVNQTLANRIAPAGNSFMVAPGQPINLQYVKLNCDQVETGSVTVTIQPSGEIVTLHDDGVAPDTMLGDGIFSAAYTPTVKGTLEFPGNDVVAFDFIKRYLAATLVDFNYRTLSPTAARLGLRDELFITGAFSGFPIRFRGESPGYATMSVGSNGYIGFHGGTFFDNTALPARPYPGLPFTTETFVAPYWDDFNPLDDIVNNRDQAAFIETQGVAPTREFIVEFRNMPHKRGLITDTGTFQIVFFENSSDVLVNYKDVKFGNAAVDDGAEATFGIQSHPTVFRQESFNSPFLTDAMSLLWQLNQPPVSRAGSDQVVNFGDTVNLNGSGSTDDANDIRSYSWLQTAGAVVSLTNANTAVASFTAPTIPGVRTFELTVTDGEGESSTSNVSVRINNPPTAVADAAPTANVGDVVTLNGSGSTDTDGTIATYAWEQTAGTAVILTNAGNAVASFTAPSAAGMLSFKLTVTDNHGATNTSVVSVHVNNPPTINVVAPAAANFGESVVLNGSGSTDTDGSIVSYAWIQTSGATVMLANGATATASFTAPNVAGTLSFKLIATDNNGATSEGTVSIRINNPPTANVVAPAAVRVGESVALNGTSSTDADGTIASYAWIQTAGTPVTLAGSNTVTATFTAPKKIGIVTFKLLVTDNNGAIGEELVSIEVVRKRIK